MNVSQGCSQGATGKSSSCSEASAFDVDLSRLRGQACDFEVVLLPHGDLRDSSAWPEPFKGELAPATELQRGCSCCQCIPSDSLAQPWPVNHACPGQSRQACTFPTACVSQALVRPLSPTPRHCQPEQASFLKPGHEVQRSDDGPTTWSPSLMSGLHALCCSTECILECPDSTPPAV